MTGKWLGGETVGVNTCFLIFLNQLIIKVSFDHAKSDKNIDFIFSIRNW